MALNVQGQVTDSNALATVCALCDANCGGKGWDVLFLFEADFKPYCVDWDTPHWSKQFLFFGRRKSAVLIKNRVKPYVHKVSGDAEVICLEFAKDCGTSTTAKIL
eukprot:8232614-Karenia_brevis.AAC.1